MTRPATAPPALVLIVEDEEPIAQALAYIVEDCGYRALIAAHGKQALEVLREHQPQLIITDLMMPLMDGRALIAHLRQSGRPLPPIVIMSAAGKRSVEDSGADAVLPKPFEVAEVELLLRRFLPPP
jgi:CheY-like chemotaxis protein